MVITSKRLFTNIDYEEKISLVELYWRGIRRIQNFDMDKKYKFPFLSLKNLKANNFEAEAVEFLSSIGCMKESNGYYKIQGKILFDATRSTSEYHFKELFTSQSSLRFHISEDHIKMEFPYSEMNDLFIANEDFTISLKSGGKVDKKELWNNEIKNKVFNEISVKIILEKCPKSFLRFMK
ncbi:hypothetical protein BEWA_007940 [Theileria equi strain WA]|uniref:Uncharacterized protein n=1 Tax=Theileria equi strain WA TaxID=1537102 RepID=L0B0Q9_THEEQ|nr:hypothetical protein BEWA_007940 [Theileria equi strain WA]AFZ81385.1 hypothetical protein BEWA_007940 [Theileria equi strain WA]|eukprot:XP_004831051.1 hypothetical protein BEWA_007940 [Theileria equi strain WA]